MTTIVHPSLVSPNRARTVRRGCCTPTLALALALASFPATSTSAIACDNAPSLIMAGALRPLASELSNQGDAPPSDPPAASFPQEQEDFETDPRVSYSKIEHKWILEESNGSEWAYDESTKRWIPSLDEALLEQQQQAYARQGVDDGESVESNKKRKQVGDSQVRMPIPFRMDNGMKAYIRCKAPNKRQKDTKDKPERKNTAVYVTSLPLDVDVDEVNETFSRCGVISEEIDSGKPRIKLYTKDDGSFKGDALVVYFRPESVQLAIQLLDDSDFRMGEEGPAGKMRVKEADWSYKKTKDNQDEGGGDAADRKADEKPQQRKGISQEQKKVIRKTEKMKAKLADWSDDEDPQQAPSRFAKLVVLKHMFTLAELEEDPAAALDIKDDIREECSKLGEVTNVVLFDEEVDGIATVKFKDNEAAQACARLMNGRAFDGRRVVAYVADGSEKFKKTKEKAPLDPEGQAKFDEEEEKRLERFGDWLEAQDGKPAAASK
ncbi:hypothetical protein FH972_022032 [Carpinus fangiana]|uniref:RRM domain-containing protein n=1 Tax=Carpinus fangiana TaxID=176857 RepID=A0A5N6KR21_9ROSI|nr:hypothetical protein FH972_022032 [Carpinus fangiana]